jgi:membrane dipeptidase
MLIVDGHLDLALNALQGNRDLIRSAYATRGAEFGQVGKGRAQGTVGLPEMRAGRVALSFVTLLARSTGEIVHHVDYARQAPAYAAAQGQLAYYRALERQGYARIIASRAGLDAHIGAWREWEASAEIPDPNRAPPLGFIILMESADPISTPGQLRAWWDAGLRIVGPAHYRQGRYAGGTASETGLTPLGRELLPEMERIGMLLDLTHLSDAAFWEALELYHGPVLASHSNCRAIVPNQRQFSDDQIRAIVARDGVIGVLLGCSDLVPGWVVGARHHGGVTLDRLVDHIDHICTLAGNARNVAIGSDLDGGVGRDEFPRDLDTIADLPSIAPLLANRGYAADDIQAILHGNWLRFLQRAWPY